MQNAIGSWEVTEAGEWCGLTSVLRNSLWGLRGDWVKGKENRMCFEGSWRL